MLSLRGKRSAPLAASCCIPGPVRQRAWRLAAARWAVPLPPCSPRLSSQSGSCATLKMAVSTLLRITSSARGVPTHLNEPREAYPRAQARTRAMANTCHLLHDHSVAQLQQTYISTVPGSAWCGLLRCPMLPLPSPPARVSLRTMHRQRVCLRTVALTGSLRTADSSRAGARGRGASCPSCPSSWSQRAGAMNLSPDRKRKGRHTRARDRNRRDRTGIHVPLPIPGPSKSMEYGVWSMGVLYSKGRKWIPVRSLLERVEALPEILAKGNKIGRGRNCGQGTT